MKKFTYTVMAVVYLASSTVAFSDGHGGHSRAGGGVSSGAALAIGVGVLFLGTVIGGASQQQQAPMQYVPVPE